MIYFGGREYRMGNSSQLAAARWQVAHERQRRGLTGQDHFGAD